jgi:hypothetical protein
MIKLPAKCGRCAATLMDSLDIAVHLGRVGAKPFRRSILYPYSRRCKELATKRNIGH